MLNNAYFASRSQILKWINSTLKVELTNIEQLGSGSIYCHLLDAAYPSKVPLQKVKWNTQMEIDFIWNFKVLQSCFEHLGIAKSIDIQRLVRAKYQDNLEFSQWMKGELGPKIALNTKYSPFQRRNWVKIDLSFAIKNKEQRNNKQNQNFQNHITTPRLSLASQRKSMGYGKSAKDLLRVTDKKEDTIKYFDTESLTRLRTRRNSSRMYTEAGPLLICEDLNIDFILQAEEIDECF